MLYHEDWRKRERDGSKRTVRHLVRNTSGYRTSHKEFAAKLGISNEISTATERGEVLIGKKKKGTYLIKITGVIDSKYWIQPGQRIDTITISDMEKKAGEIVEKFGSKISHVEEVHKWIME